MRVLIACEFSGVVRDAFNARGHLACSIDLEPSERVGEHYVADVRDYLRLPWDMIIAFPPCTHLCRSGARYWKHKQAEQAEAVQFVKDIWASYAPRVAIENPIGILSTLWQKPTQIIQPWQHGHGETKATCLWLKGLPLLQPSCVVDGRDNRVARMPDSKGRAKERSRTYQGVADAMAAQWG